MFSKIIGVLYFKVHAISCILGLNLTFFIFRLKLFLFIKIIKSVICYF